MILQFSERLGKIISKFLGSYINRSSGGDIPARLLYGRRGSLNNRVSPIKTVGENHFIAAGFILLFPGKISGNLPGMVYDGNCCGKRDRIRRVQKRNLWKRLKKKVIRLLPGRIKDS